MTTSSYCTCPGDPETEYKTRITCTSQDGVVSCMHCGLPLPPVSSEMHEKLKKGAERFAEDFAEVMEDLANEEDPSPPQNVGERKCCCDECYGGASRPERHYCKRNHEDCPCHKTDPTPRGEEENYCGYCGMKLTVSIWEHLEKECKKTTPQVRHAPTVEEEFDEEFPALEWFDCPSYLTPEEAARKVKEWITHRLQQEREEAGKEGRLLRLALTHLPNIYRDSVLDTFAELKKMDEELNHPATPDTKEEKCHIHYCVLERKHEGDCKETYD